MQIEPASRSAEEGGDVNFGAATAGERDAAEAAAVRLQAKLDEVSRRDPPIKMKFSLPDEWSVQCSSPCADVMAFGHSDIRGSARRRSWSGRRDAFFDTVVWRQFSDPHTDLWLYFEQLQNG